MTNRAPITKAEARRIAEVVKAAGVMARIIMPSGAIVEFVPDIQETNSPARLDRARIGRGLFSGGNLAPDGKEHF